MELRGLGCWNDRRVLFLRLRLLVMQFCRLGRRIELSLHRNLNVRLLLCELLRLQIMRVTHLRSNGISRHPTKPIRQYPIANYGNSQ